MNFKVDKAYLILGSIAIVCGMVVAFVEPVGGSLMAAVGGIGLQLKFEPEPKKKVTKKVKDEHPSS